MANDTESQHHHQEGQPTLDESQWHESQPLYDTSAGSRTACIAATSIGAAAALVCLVCGGVIVSNNPTTVSAGYVPAFDAGPEVASFAINLVLTLCNSAMMYGHAVSLRWAPYAEGRLEYNTNIRLLTSSRNFGPNRWCANLLALFCLVLTYASSATTFVSVELALESDTHKINGTALVAMGIGLAGQAALAAWCLVAVRHRPILTWSSNPLNTALAAVQHGHLTHQPGRCMLSVHQTRHFPNQSYQAYALKTQRSMFGAVPMVPFIVVLLWALAALALAWAVTTLLVLRSSNLPTHGLSFCSGIRDCYWNSISLYFSPQDNDVLRSCTNYPTAAKAVFCVLFVCLIQGCQTIGLHCVELLVNVSRDESTWRGAHADGASKRAPGARLQTNPLFAAISCWESLVLFFAKAILHWVIGLAMMPGMSMPSTNTDCPDAGEYRNQYSFNVNITYPALLIYAILTVLLASFTTFIALRQRKGYLPVTLGHLPTIANLVDDWRTDCKGRLWWGDKTPEQGETEATGTADPAPRTCTVRHAGTSPESSEVRPILAGWPYAGSV